MCFLNSGNTCHSMFSINIPCKWALLLPRRAQLISCIQEMWTSALYPTKMQRLSLPLSVTLTHFASLVILQTLTLTRFLSMFSSFLHLPFFLPRLLFQMFYLYWTLFLGWYTLLHPLLSCRTHTPMQTSCWRRPSSLPKRASATPRRSTRPPTSSKTGSKTLFAAWSSAKSCWICLSPSTRTSKR